MSGTETMSDAYELPPGILCPCCKTTELRLGGDHARPSLLCAACGVFLRLLTRHGDPTPGYEPRPAGASEYAFDAPPAGSWWIGMIRQRDEVWRAVALTEEQ